MKGDDPPDAVEKQSGVTSVVPHGLVGTPGYVQSPLASHPLTITIFASRAEGEGREYEAVDG